MSVLQGPGSGRVRIVIPNGTVVGRLETGPVRAIPFDELFQILLDAGLEISVEDLTVRTLSESGLLLDSDQVVLIPGGMFLQLSSAALRPGRIVRLKRVGPETAPALFLAATGQTVDGIKDRQFDSPEESACIIASGPTSWSMF